MQHDDMIWNVINHQFCSHKAQMAQTHHEKHQHFCRHPYSTTGLCNRGSCPLANSKYAVIREIDGVVSLFIKTPERAHSPKNLWERIQLSRNYAQAMQQLDEHLAYFPKIQIHRNKQRLTKIHQYLIRMRKIELKVRAGKKAKLVPRSKKVDVREDRREEKALVAAKIEDRIEKELLGRLAKGTYGDIYNFPEVQFSKIMDRMEDGVNTEEEKIEEEDEEEMEVETNLAGKYFVEDLEDFDDENIDMEDFEYPDDSDEQSDDTSVSDEEDEDNDSETSSTDDDDDEESSKPELKPIGKKRSDAIAKKKSSNKKAKIQLEYEEEEEEIEPAQSVEILPGMAW